MTSSQKAKGSAFEREVAKFLSELYSESFIRNISGSGAYVGGKNFHRTSKLSEQQILSTRGDIHCPETFSNLNIECKSYAQFEFHQLLSESKQLETWLEQMMTVSDEHSLNVLCFKITRRGRYVAVQTHIDWALPFNHSLYHSKKHGNWYVMSFESFFDYNHELVDLLSKKTQLDNTTQNRAGSTTLDLNSDLNSDITHKNPYRNVSI